MQKSFEFSGAQGKRASLNLAMTNRHGLITGATGSGKTVTLQTLVEGFSRAGVPAFVTDIKGDLSGLAQPGEQSLKIIARLEQLLLNTYSNRPYPVILWDLFGKKGHPVRTTISDMGPLLLSSLLDLNGTQTAILYACFKIADDEGLLLLDMKDLRSMLTWMAENRKSLQKAYGNISSASVAAIQRSLLVLEQQGAEQLFGEPVLQLRDLMQVDFSGNGVVSLLDATSLLPQPKLYSTFLLWLLAELFEQLPEVGDLEKPVLVLFFDEAHLIFKNAPDVLLEKVEQVVRLIRSKGVGVYFVSQTPADIPISIAGQLGNRIQHALRAFTPKDQKMVKAAAQTLRSNPKINTEQAISQLTVGEALVSVLDENGQPSSVEQLLIFPPQSRIGPLTPDERQQHLARSPLVSRYDVVIDRESAHEILKQRAEKIALFEENVKPARKVTAQTERSQVENLVGAMAKSAVRTIGTQLGRQIVRGLLGSLLGGKKR
jgi:DNA double-strand break repair helicase HerA and related ATPase